MNIYVGNLAPEVTEEELRESFSQFGTVDTARIIKDKFTGQARGFAFVEMPNQAEAQAAIGALNGKDFKGKALTVNEARPKTEGGGGRGGFGGGGGRGGYGGGRGGSGGSRGVGRGGWKGFNKW